MVTINNLQTQEDKTVKVEYTINFNGTNHNLYGNFVASPDEIQEAMKNNSGTDPFSGTKEYVLKKLQTEVTNTLAENK